ncbi:PAS-domain containing protein [uncultured Sneathiella sp.]|jgi:signal transduction histidine kinase|uniref:sensor histidine kinase n=1 Tax=uncultured Sneathiella sp. TaxID=879315 RepID=UPI0030DB2E06|tara:strand:+ start:38180 stop:40279 length:2100 start_codon:yes stop_codon:yes gene_type:complete
MIEDFTSTQLMLVWILVLGLVGLAMAFLVMRKKALALLAQGDRDNDKLLSLEETIDNLKSEQERQKTETISLKSSLATARGERDDFIELLNVAPIAIWRRDQNSKIIWQNRKYADIVGLKEEGTTVPELAPSRDPDQARKLATKARVTGVTQSEVRRYIVEGDRLSFKIVETPLEFDNQLAGFALDTTTEAELSEELKRHIDGHADVLENITSAIAIYGPDQRLEFFNQTYAKLWRISDDFLYGKPTISEVLDKQRELRRLPEQADFSSYKEKRRALFTNVIEMREELVQLPDETVLRTIITPHPFGGLLFLFEDVTDKVGLERARNTQIAVQRATLDNLYEGVAVFGADARLKLYNAAYCAIWGIEEGFLQEDSHISQIIEHFLEKTGATWSDAYREKYIANVTRRDAASGRIDHPGGNIIDFNRVPLPDGNVLFTYVDVTHELRAQRALRERNEALEAADKMKTEFVASVSHELRTPLNTIIGFAEILVKEFFGPLNDKQVEYGQGILDSSDHLLLLINDILDMANIQAGRMELDKAPVDLASTLQNVVTMVQERAKKRHLEIRTEIDDDLGLVEVDERRIKQVVFNLFSNAIKFTPAKGQIILSAHKTAEGFDVTIKDTGKGIAEDQIEQIFERFSKGDTTKQNAGAGLGLSLVRSFVELHGGRVELTSKENVGTTVSCYLPASLAVEPLPMAERS